MMEDSTIRRPRGKVVSSGHKCDVSPEQRIRTTVVSSSSPCLAIDDRLRDKTPPLWSFQGLSHRQGEQPDAILHQENLESSVLRSMRFRAVHRLSKTRASSVPSESGARRASQWEKRAFGRDSGYGYLALFFVPSTSNFVEADSSLVISYQTHRHNSGYHIPSVGVRKRIHFFHSSRCSKQTGWRSDLPFAECELVSSKWCLTVFGNPLRGTSRLC